jgi:hypothetical protein
MSARPAFVSLARLHEPQRRVWFGVPGRRCERASLPLRVTDPRSGVILALALLLVLVVVPVGLVGVIILIVRLTRKSGKAMTPNASLPSQDGRS